MSFPLKKATRPRLISLSHVAVESSLHRQPLGTTPRLDQLSKVWMAQSPTVRISIGHPLRAPIQQALCLKCLADLRRLPSLPRKIVGMKIHAEKSQYSSSGPSSSRKGVSSWETLNSPSGTHVLRNSTSYGDSPDVTDSEDLVGLPKLDTIYKRHLSRRATKRKPSEPKQWAAGGGPPKQQPKLHPKREQP